MKLLLALTLLGAFVWACAATGTSLVNPVLPPVSITQDCTAFRVQLTFERTPAGVSRYRVSLTATDQATQPLSQVERVILAFTSRAEANSTTTVVVQPEDAEPGVYTPQGGFTPSSGSWLVEVIVRRSDQPDASCTVPVTL